MEQLKLAFGYEARVGKDFAVEYLIKTYGGQKISFAGAIYDIMGYAQDICDFKKTKDRDFLQTIGTWARKKDRDVWVNVVIKKIQEIGDKNIYISDVRYPNEFEALKKEGFTLVLIKRCEEERMRDFKNDAGGSAFHSSEVSLRRYENKFDHKIENNGTKEEFYDALDNIVKDLL